MQVERGVRCNADTPTIGHLWDWICSFTSHSPEVGGSVWVWWWFIQAQLHRGQWVTSMTRVNINQFRQLIDEDAHLSIQRVSALLYISYGNAHTILNDHLNMEKICAMPSRYDTSWVVKRRDKVWHMLKKWLTYLTKPAGVHSQTLWLKMRNSFIFYYD